MAANQDPSPEEIAQRTAEIRKGWSADEHFRRLRVDLRPTFSLADGRRGTMTSEDYADHHDAAERLQDADDG